MKRGHVPVRTCKGCGKKAPKEKLTRFVVDDGVLVQKEQNNGYGMYCCPTEVCRKKMQIKLKKRK